MARPLNPANLDDAVHRYLAGETIQQIQAATGVSSTRLHRERVARGIPPRRRELPADQVVRQYVSGASEYALARQYGVSRGPIARILAESGITRRGMSDAGLIRNARLSPDERKRQVAAANRAARARRVPQIEKSRNALRAEAAGLHDSEGERVLAEMLRERGLAPVAQRAVGPYNVDLAVLPVAVEVLGGGWHALKSAHSERSPYILDDGWHLVMVWDYEGRSALGPGAADYLVAFVDEVRRNPPATCQYRVITGQGQVLAASGREDNEFPLEPPPRSGF